MTNGSGDSRTMGSGPLFGDAAKAAMARGGSAVGPQGTRAPGESASGEAEDTVATTVPRGKDETTATERPKAPRDSRPDQGTRPVRDDTAPRAPDAEDRSGRDRRTPAMPPTRVLAGTGAKGNGTAAAAGAAAGAGAAARRPMTVGTAPVARKKGRRARLTVKRIDPWTTLKFSFVYGLAGMVVLLVTVIVLYGVVDAMGIIDSIRTFIGDVSSNNDSSGVLVWLGFSRVMLVAVVIGAINVVLFTAFATLTAFIYNVCTDIVGGVEVTLAERS